MVRILIADDHPVVRAGLRDLLGRSPAFEVIGEAADGDALLALVKSKNADVLLLDVSMPGPPFLEVLQRVRDLAPALKVLVLTIHPEDQFAIRALRLGASGYLTKDRTPEELVDAVTRIGRGGRYLSASLAERLASALDSSFDAAPHDGLSDREYQVLLMLGKGLSVTEVSKKLKLSVKTVSTYRTRLMKKMTAQSNADLVAYVTRHGLNRQV